MDNDHRENVTATAGDLSDAYADLIARLEKATGPDRESDFLIFEAAFFPKDYLGSKIESWSRSGGAGYTVNTADGMRHLSAFNAPNFTHSIDTAMTLVPKDTHAMICGVNQSWLVALTSTPQMPHHPPVTTFSGQAAVALCIAALKARSVVRVTGNPKTSTTRGQQ